MHWLRTGVFEHSSAGPGWDGGGSARLAPDGRLRVKSKSHVSYQLPSGDQPVVHFQAIRQDESPVMSLDLLTDLIINPPPSFYWTCQGATVACAPKPGYLLLILTLLYLRFI